MRIILTVMLACLSFFGAAQKADIQPDNLYPRVKMETTLGDIVLELNRSRAPMTVDNFLKYVVAGSYNGTIFHRVIPDYIAQGGGYDVEYVPRAEGSTVFNESGNGLSNDLGTIAMARQTQPHSGTRQFFLNLEDNESLNPIPKWGYTVFGYIVEGEEIIEKLSETETNINMFTGWPDVPVEPVILKKATLLPPE